MPRSIVFFMLGCFLLFASFSPARCDEFNDIVYLKNGSVIKGVIIEQVLGKTIKIQTRDGSLFVYKYNEIEKIGKQVGDEASGWHKDTKYQNFSTLDFTLPFSDWGTGVVQAGFTTVNGARLGDNFSLGLGLGYSGYYSSIYFPLFLDARVYLPNDRVEPYFFAKVGYGFFASSWGDSASGLLLGLGTGLQVSLHRNFCFVLNVGVDLQNYTYDFLPGQNFQVNFLRISPGLAF